jgi:hypothetical protein
MSRVRNPEYDVRDRQFAELCAKCSRRDRCAFKDEPEGAESVCMRLIEGGTYNCESCIRRNIGGGCVVECCFFRLLLS